MEGEIENLSFDEYDTYSEVEKSVSWEKNRAYKTPDGILIQYRLYEGGTTWKEKIVDASKREASITGLKAGKKYICKTRAFFYEGDKRYFVEYDNIDYAKPLKNTKKNRNLLAIEDKEYNKISKDGRANGWIVSIYRMHGVGYDNDDKPLPSWPHGKLDHFPYYSILLKNKTYTMTINYYACNKSHVHYYWYVWDKSGKTYKVGGETVDNTVFSRDASYNKILKKDIIKYAEGSIVPHLNIEYLVYKKGAKVTLKILNTKGSVKWSLPSKKSDWYNNGGIKIVKKTKNSAVIKFTKLDGKGYLGPCKYIKAKVGGNTYFCEVWHFEGSLI